MMMAVVVLDPVFTMYIDVVICGRFSCKVIIVPVERSPKSMVLLPPVSLLMKFIPYPKDPC
jgi:hypothetical protein